LADRIFELIKTAIANEQGPVRVSLGQGYNDRRGFTTKAVIAVGCSRRRYWAGI
jgi:hypothetical protein